MTTLELKLSHFEIKLHGGVATLYVSISRSFLDVHEYLEVLRFQSLFDANTFSFDPCMSHKRRLSTDTNAPPDVPAAHANEQEYR